jgi:hypothetical protein
VEDEENGENGEVISEAGVLGIAIVLSLRREVQGTYDFPAEYPSFRQQIGIFLVIGIAFFMLIGNAEIHTT